VSGARVVVVSTDDDMAAFWFHLTEDHGLSLTSLHGDPFLMHGAVEMFGLCDRQYRAALANPEAS
jgi:hypothetical protein